MNIRQKIAHPQSLGQALGDFERRACVALQENAILKRFGPRRAGHSKEESMNTTLKDIVTRIERFDRTCQKLEYTDTGAAWDLLNGIKADLRAILKPKATKRKKGK